MTTLTTNGGFDNLPIIGLIARNITRDANLFFCILATVLIALVAAVMTWGIVALAISAVAMVPVMLVILVLITLG